MINSLIFFQSMNFNIGSFDEIIQFCRQNDKYRSCRILVIGIGGGSDALSAYAITSKLFNCFKQLECNVKIAYANTKRGSPRTMSFSRGSGGHIFSFTTNESIPLTPNCQVHGSLTLEESLPRNEFGTPSPLLFYLKDRNAIDNYDEYLKSFRNLISTFDFDVVKRIQLKC
jgi:hypothetical protein